MTLFTLKPQIKVYYHRITQILRLRSVTTSTSLSNNFDFAQYKLKRIFLTKITCFGDKAIGFFIIFLLLV